MSIVWRFIMWRFGLIRSDIQSPSVYVPEYATPDIEHIQNPDPQAVQVTWVGHSTFLIQTRGMNILTDPMWSDRASPISWAGPKRRAHPGLRFEDLPKIDVVLVSHTHYDHLDRPTILHLGTAPQYVVAEHTKSWFVNEKITNVSELSWWKSETIGNVTIHAVPAKHWSKRKIFGKENMGWGGYIIESPAGTVYFTGDTGYHESYFKEIGKRFPHIDLGLIPIGAYYPQEIFGTYHVDPDEAVLVHQEVGARQSLGMHWGTFKLTQEPMDEPPKLLAKVRDAAGISPDAFSTMQIGETRIFNFKRQ